MLQSEFFSSFVIPSRVPQDLTGNMALHSISGGPGRALRVGYGFSLQAFVLRKFCFANPPLNFE